MHADGHVAPLDKIIGSGELAAHRRPHTGPGRRAPPPAFSLRPLNYLSPFTEQAELEDFGAGEGRAMPHVRRGWDPRRRPRDAPRREQQSLAPRRFAGASRTDPGDLASFVLFFLSLELL